MRSILLSFLILVSAPACGRMFNFTAEGTGPGGDRFVFSPNGRHTYLPAFAGRAINAFQVDMSLDESLSHIGSHRMGLNTGIVFHPTLPFAYVGRELDPRRGPGGVQVYGYSAASGELTDLGTESLPNYSFAADLTVSPDGRFLIVGVAGGQGPGRILVYAIQSTTGALTLQSNTPLDFAARGVRVRPDATWLYSLDPYRNKMLIFRYTADTGTLQFSSMVDILDRATDFRLHPSGRFAYLGCIGEPGMMVYALGDDGSFTALEAPALDNTNLDTRFADGDLQQPGAYVSAIAVSADGRFIYVTMPCYRVIHVLAVDAVTGHLTHVERKEDVSFDCVRGLSLTLSPDGRYGVAPTGESSGGSTVLYYSIDPVTGRLHEKGVQFWPS